jgi:hypothetical protein
MATVVLNKLVALADITNPYALIATELAASYFGNKLDKMLLGRRHAAHPPDVATSRSEYGLGKRVGFGLVQCGGNQIEGWDKIKSLSNGHVRTALMHSLGEFPFSPVLRKLTTSGNKVPYDSTKAKNDLKYGQLVSNGLMFYPGSDTTVDPNWADYNSGLDIPDETPNYCGSAAGGDEVRVSIWDWRVDKKYGGTTPDLVYTLASSVIITLDMIFKYVCEKYGLIDGDHFDFSNLATIKVYDPDDEANFGDGWIWEEGMSGLEFLDKLCKAYFLDFVEKDYQLVAIGWGQDPCATIDENEAGVSQGTTRTYAKPFVDVVVGDPTKYPLYTYINYQSKELDYQRGQGTGFHVGADPLMTSRVSEQLPLFTVDAKAAQIAQTMNDAGWIRDTERTTAVSFRRGPNICSDVVTITADGITRDWKISHIEREPLGAATWTLIPEDGSITSQAGNLGSSGNGGDGGDHQPPVPSKAVVFSAPDIRDPDRSTPRIYMVVCGDGPDADKWVEAVAMMQRAGSSDWVTLGVISKAGIIGTATTALLASGATAGAFDGTNTVSILLDGIGNVLEGTTEDAARNLPYPSNYAWLQIGDSGELIAYAGAAKVGSDWVLSDILRALRGSALGVHTIGNLFAVLDPAQSQVYTFPAPQDSVDETVTIKIVSDGQDLSDSDVFTTTVKIARPLGNATVPSSLVFGPPGWQHDQEFRIVQLKHLADITSQGAEFQWQHSPDGGAYVGPSSDPLQYFGPGDILIDSWGPGHTMQWRARTIAANKTASDWIYSDNTDYIPPNLQQLKFPATVCNTDPSFFSGWTFDGTFYTAPANGALAAIDGFSSYVVGSSGVLPSRILNAVPGGDIYNGLWDVALVGDGSHKAKLSRCPDMAQTGDLVVGLSVYVQNGVALTGNVGDWRLKVSGVLNTDPLTFERIARPGGAYSRRFGEVPSGPTTTTNANDTYTATSTIATSSEVVNVYYGASGNPLRQVRAVHYNVSGASIIFTATNVPATNPDGESPHVLIDYDPA